VWRSPNEWLQSQTSDEQSRKAVELITELEAKKLLCTPTRCL